MNSAVKLVITDYGYEALPIKTLYLSNLNNMSKESETLQKHENVNDFIRFFGYDPESLLEGVYGHKSDLKHILNEYEKWLVKKRSIPVFVKSLPNDEEIYIQKRVCELVSSIYFYGGFKAETHNERELAELLSKLGYMYKNEDELIAKLHR